MAPALALVARPKPAPGFGPFREGGYTRAVPSREPVTGARAGRASNSEEATRLLRLAARGGEADADRLLVLVYDELRSLAAALLERERPDHTLQPTALVHEAWMRLIDQRETEWRDQRHFLAIAAQAMRRILVDHARARRRIKRGGEWARVEAGEAEGAAADPDLDLVAVDAALTKLRSVAERPARVVELRFFGGLASPQVADVLEVSLSTVEREWRFARAWLASELERAEP
jgi:RNA polymerase sigma factor (TIGR02999 family)